MQIAGTAKACFVCYKPTTTVLATINIVDFLYTCPGHLSDSGFATLVKDEEKSVAVSVSAEEIAKVKLKWEEKQKKEKDSDAKDNKIEIDNDKDRSKQETSLKPTSTTPSTPVTHERYILHRNFFAS